MGATYVSYAPASVIARAMFNFDVWDLSNFRLSGTIRVSVSDSFSTADYTGYSYSNFSSDLYTASPEMAWTARMTDNVQALLAVYSQLANVTFDFRGDVDSGMGPDDTPNPEDVGRANFSDINISWVERAGSDFSGMSGLNTDGLSLSGGFGYTGGAGDIFLNAYYLADTSLDLGTHGWEVLQHEIGHSLGLSHPFGPGGSWAVTADYAATAGLGFNQLGFRTATAADMNKEYFTVMSYDDQPENAHTPMILDVIALQQAYGEGAGTHGAGNDTIAAGNLGYRVYFDKGGIDTIDLELYETGASLHMGVSISGAAHLVGVAMSQGDRNTLASGGDPRNLRWFYGEYENALGGAGDDSITGNSLNNVIDGRGGNDVIQGGGGTDTAFYSGSRSQYRFTARTDGAILVADQRTAAPDGSDTVAGIELLQFADSSVDLAANRAPSAALTAPGFSLLQGRSLQVAGMFSLSDANGDPVTALELWDGNGGGFLRVNGVRQGSNTAIAVNPASLSGVTYVGETAGTDTLFVRASDGFAWSGWTNWAMTVTPNSAPVVTPASSTQAVATGQTVTAASLFRTSDADGDAIASYRFWDSNGGGRFERNGVALASAQWVEISAGNLAGTVYRGGAAQGTEQVWVQASDGTTWSASAAWTMQSQRTSNVAPMLTAPVARNAEQSQWLRLSDFVTVADADGDAIQAFRVRDGNTAAGSGRLWAQGNYLASGTQVTVMTAGLSDLWVQGGTANGIDAIEIEARDVLGAWSGVAGFNLVTRLPNRAPVVTPTAATQSVNASQALSAASLFATSDADGDAMTQYEFLDVGVGGGRFRVNGTPMGEGDGSNWTVSAAQLAQTTYTGGAGAGSETIWVRASDGTAWSAWKSWTMQTQAGGSSGAGAGAGTNQAPVVTAAAAIQTVAANTAVGASTLFGATDADGNGTITAYEFLDVGVGGGRFRVNGTAMGEGDGKNFIVSAAQLMQTTYTGGLNAGTETLWVRASDGTAWSAWKSWQMGTLAG